MYLNKLTIRELRRRLDADEVTPEQIVSDISAEISRNDGDVGAYLASDAARAMTGYTPAPGAALDGIPVAVKDNICDKGGSASCGSKILKGFEPVYDATVVAKLRGVGAVIHGKTNLDEFAMGSSTENSAYGPTRNPWALDRVPGGSSGGSAAAVAAGEAICALGSDTGGSIRQPAAFCGVVGLKPTYGLVSRYGLVAFASSLDQVGPITKTVQDAAVLLAAIAGHDEMDSTSVAVPIPDYQALLDKDIAGLRVGLVSELCGDGIDAGVRSAFYEGVAALRRLGAVVEEVSLPTLEYALAAYYIIAPAEASSNLARFDGVRYGFRAADVNDILHLYTETRSQGFGSEVKRRIMLGTYALSAGYYEAYYGQAQKVRTVVIDDFKRAFQGHDVLISPTTPTTAFRIGEKIDDPMKMYMSDICTIPANLAGIPAISLPCGLAGGLPVGLQIMGDYFSEAALLGVANRIEEELGLLSLDVKAG